MKILQTKMLFSCAGFFYGYFKNGGIYGRNQEEIHGRSAHGSAPDQGKDAIVAAAAIVMGLQTLSSRVNDPQNTFVLNVGMMNGGTQSNIITGEVELVGTTLPSTSTKTPSRMAVPSMHDLPSTAWKN